MSKAKPKSQKPLASLKGVRATKKTPSSKTITAVRHGTKLSAVIALLSRPAGVTIIDLATATGWQPHTVRSVLSRALVKDRRYKITSDTAMNSKQRIYRIANNPQTGGKR